MRTLGTIIEEARDGNKPHPDELRYALVAVEVLRRFDQQSFMRVSKNPKLAEKEWELHFERWKRATALSPKEWLGPNHDPDSPEVQERRKRSTEIFQKILNNAKGEDNGQSNMPVL